MGLDEDTRARHFAVEQKVLSLSMTSGVFKHHPSLIK